MNKEFVGIDESYDADNEAEGRSFVMACIKINNEKDLKYIYDYLKILLNKLKIKEFKGNKISDDTKLKIFKALDKIDYECFLVVKNINDFKGIDHCYKLSLLKFSTYIKDFLEKKHITIKLDNIYGEEFQRECISIINKKAKNSSLKINAKYTNSHSNFLIQLADIFANYYRVNLKLKTKKLYKNKYRILS